MVIATKSEFSKDMIQPSDGEDTNQAESVAFMRYHGLHHNRFLYATYVDVLVSTGQTAQAMNVLEELKTIDAIRHKFYEWRKRRIGGG